MAPKKATMATFVAKRKAPVEREEPVELAVQEENVEETTDVYLARILMVDAGKKYASPLNLKARLAAVKSVKNERGIILFRPENARWMYEFGGMVEAMGFDAALAWVSERFRAGISMPEIFLRSPLFDSERDAYRERIKNLTMQIKIKGVRKCKECQSTNTFYVLKQLRSSDEPMSELYTCQDCGHNF